MNNQKVDIGKIALLVLLLCGLGAGVFHMMRTINGQRAPRKTIAQQAEGTGVSEAPATSTYDKTKPASTTNMPPVAGSKGPQAAKPSSGVAMRANDNLFKVFGMQPAKNPFLRQEDWYKEDLEAQLPGYPEVRDSGYLETMESTVPLDLLGEFPGDPEWESVTVRKQHTPNAYSIEGYSKDGSITTSIMAEAATPDAVDFTWSQASGIPLSELAVPGWEERYNVDVISEAPDEGTSLRQNEEDTSGGAGLPPLPDLSNGSTGIGGGLPSPGDVMNGSGAGDFLAVSGINLQDGRKSALMFYNGQHFIVAEGSVLPTHYQVLSINADGVVLLELRDGSSRFVPLASVKRPESER